MLIRSPNTLHYPITITELVKRPQDQIGRSSTLFCYTYTSTVTEGNKYGEEKEIERTFPTTFESATEGTLTRWSVEVGSVVRGPNVVLAHVEEPCRHSMQFGGMCTECGKDMTVVDYNTTAPDTSRANTAVAHIDPALRISDEEAARMDEEAKQRLLDGGKLSLVVDLDLTIIHASVDPTIGEWQKDETNPNHGAVADVRSFELYDDALQRDVSYYIKLRPYLTEFLKKISQLYELHIYTMGTRSYADNIAKIVDPDKRLFGDRILSRTETPGEDSKNLRKIFPVDNKMVVIIDDRADVWKWSNYLVRVQPFNFFVGIGDINSSFLPNQDNLLDSLKKDDKGPAPAQDSNDTPASTEATATPKASTRVGAPEIPVTPSNPNESALGQLVSMQEGNDIKTIERKTAEQDENLAAQLNDRPLLQLQKSLEKAEDEAGEDPVTPTTNGESKPVSPPKVHQTLLKDDDEELVRIQDVLVKIQENFYTTYDENRKKVDADNDKHRRSQRELQTLIVPDVKDVIQPLKTETLRGAYIVFTRMVPLDVDIFKTRWADMAMRLGAIVQTDISKTTTHVVAKPGDPTSKMRKAAARGIKIVRADWLWDSSGQWWNKVDETPYLIHVDPGMISRRTQTLGDDLTKDSDDEPEYDHDESRLGLTIDIKPNGTNPDDDDEELQSPDGDIHDTSWDAVFDDDNEDDPLSEYDSEAEPDDRGSDVSDSSQLSVPPVTTNGQKRKRPDGEADSILQKRKRQALARSSSLTNVRLAEPTPPPPPTTAGDPEAEATVGDLAAPTVGDPEEEDRDAVEDGLAADDVGDEDDGFELAMQEALAQQANGDDEYGDDDGG